MNIKFIILTAAALLSLNGCKKDPASYDAFDAAQAADAFDAAQAANAAAKNTSTDAVVYSDNNTGFNTVEPVPTTPVEPQSPVTAICVGGYLFAHDRAANTSKQIIGENGNGVVCAEVQ